MAPIQHRDVAAILKKQGYTEIKKIGEGSFGKAILVRDDAGAKLVCKMVDVSKASAKETSEAVKEAKLLSSLKHPYIVHYRDSFIKEGWLCIIMDFCEGGDLSSKIDQARKSRKPLSEDEVLKLLTQALLALKYIHEKHILHRDLKPGNFFLSSSGNLKMGDFGIAKVLDCTVACARTQIGTPYYLSPEVCQEKPYTWPSDIWAMGCILYELCALKVPFDAPSISGLVQRILKSPAPEVPPRYSDFVRGLCAEMLNKDPKKRPSPEEILQRPRMRAVVQQMLAEAQAHQAPEAVAEPSAEAAAAPAVEPVAMAARAPVPERQEPESSPFGDLAGNYKKGDLVEYHSSTHKDWLPAKVNDVDSKGSILINLKPNAWISKEEQSTKIRPRWDSHPKPVARQAAPPSRAASPRDWRSPSMARDFPRAVASPSPIRQRSPSVGRMSPTPSSNALRPSSRGQSPSPRPYGTPSRDNTPRPSWMDSPGRAAGARAGTPSGARAGTPSGSPPKVAGYPKGSPVCVAGAPLARPPCLPPAAAAGGGCSSRCGSPAGIHRFGGVGAMVLAGN
eukprot:gnl/TRDRNA2_/TRDRNA2_176460_c3_seq9.p1 gnl/TRDRNA2_/TRDRNA2_176460_c3~~gnl/TRDRNA2_/TRDRNA2_176460_c3_seq9.p1  ORF type:complete len:563 (+),score=112.99 gnl/TRDRNA2_/TRDRNA2_176460_c3_seq9:92-1780(+)